MPARPIETFQSEGWYRPSGARSEHYFRPSDRMSARLGTPSLEAICAPKNGLGYGSGEGIRPWLESTAMGRVCKQCAQIQEAALFAEGDWFGSADPVHPPMPVGHIRACGCPECVAWLEAHEPAERCSMCRDGVSHSARCHHDEHEVCDRVAEGTDAPKSCACPCHSPGDPS